MNTMNNTMKFRRSMRQQPQWYLNPHTSLPSIARHFLIESRLPSCLFKLSQSKKDAYTPVLWRSWLSWSARALLIIPDAAAGDYTQQKKNTNASPWKLTLTLWCCTRRRHTKTSTLRLPWSLKYFLYAPSCGARRSPWSSSKSRRKRTFQIVFPENYTAIL